MRNKFPSEYFGDAPESVSAAEGSSLEPMREEITKALQDACAKAGINGPVAIMNSGGLLPGPHIMFSLEALGIPRPEIPGLIKAAPAMASGQTEYVREDAHTAKLTDEQYDQLWAEAMEKQRIFSEAFAPYRQAYRDATRNTAIGELAQEDRKFASAYNANPEQAMLDYGDELESKFRKIEWVYTP
jgi:hypothetical protein